MQATMPKTNRYRVTLKAGRNVVRNKVINCASEEEAKEYGKLMIKRKGYDDTLITIHVDLVI